MSERASRENLHDTLLQSFQGAAFQFQAARKLLLRNADNAMQVSMRQFKQRRKALRRDVPRFATCARNQPRSAIFRNC
jgi:signal transduction histidine kinase